MGIFGLLSSKGKGKQSSSSSKKGGKALKLNKSAKKKAKTCEFC